MYSVWDFKLASQGHGPISMSFGRGTEGIHPPMELPLVLIVIGIIVAAVVHSGLGIAMILIGLVLLLWPRIRTAAR